MGLFHKKSGLLPGTESTKPQRQKKPMSPAAKKRLLLTLVNTIVVFVLYYTLVALIHSSTGIKILMTVYATCLAGLLIAYVVYNKGFVYRNVTPEMLPDTLSDAQKTAILEEADTFRLDLDLPDSLSCDLYRGILCALYLGTVSQGRLFQAVRRRHPVRKVRSPP